MARVTFENVGKKYGKLWALREFNARFEPGELDQRQHLARAQSR